MQSLPNFNSKWMNHFRKRLNETDRPGIWFNKEGIESKTINKVIKQVPIDQNYQKWKESLEHSNKGVTFPSFIDRIILEEYLLKLNRHILEFRTAIHHFPIKTGRWNNIEYNDRKCNFCNSNESPDVYHYLLTCQHFPEFRLNHIKPYYINTPNKYKFKALLKSTEYIQLTNFT